jgi:hypothetical protein
MHVLLLDLSTPQGPELHLDTELGIDIIFLVQIIDSPIVGFLSLITNSPIVFQWSDNWYSLMVSKKCNSISALVENQENTPRECVRT